MPDCPFNPSDSPCDLELDLMILREAEREWECPNAQLKKIKKGKGDRRAWMSGTIAVLLKPEAVIGPYENS